MKFNPKNPPKAGDMQVSSSFLNDLLRRIERLETIHAKSPLSLQDSMGGLCLSLTKDIQNFRVAQALEGHNGGPGDFAQCKIQRYDGVSQDFVADNAQEITVYDPFLEGFWAGQTILVTKYYDADKWIHIPVQGRYLYGITQQDLEPCSTVGVERFNGLALLGEFYQAFNPHDWTAQSGVFIQAKWFPVAQSFSIYAVDCETSCLGL